MKKCSQPRILIGLVVLLALAACRIEAAEKSSSLLEARRGFKTKLSRSERESEKLEPPPKKLFSLVQYRTPIGKMDAYLSTSPAPGKKHPAIIWITGGFPAGGIDSSAWEPVSSDNDQSAKAYREAGVVMMYPTLRGSFGNPGSQESFYGEVDDVLAALEYLRKVAEIGTFISVST